MSSGESQNPRWLAVKTCPTPFAAEQVQLVLERNGIPAIIDFLPVIFDRAIFGPLTGCAEGFPVVVPEERAGEAREILRAYFPGL